MQRSSNQGDPLRAPLKAIQLWCRRHTSRWKRALWRVRTNDYVAYYDGTCNDYDDDEYHIAFVINLFNNIITIVIVYASSVFSLLLLFLIMDSNILHCAEGPSVRWRAPLLQEKRKRWKKERGERDRRRQTVSEEEWVSERERKSVCVSVREREFFCVWVWEREFVYVCRVCRVVVKGRASLQLSRVRRPRSE